jgi:hypothetical protein
MLNFHTKIFDLNVKKYHLRRNCDAHYLNLSIYTVRTEKKNLVITFKIGYSQKQYFISYHH